MLHFKGVIFPLNALLQKIGLLLSLEKPVSLPRL